MSQRAPKKKPRPRGARRDPHYPDLFQPSPFTEESRKKRARARRRKAFVGWPLKVLTVVAAVLLIATLLVLLPQFTIEKITVTGTRLIDDQAVAGYAQSFVGAHFLTLVDGSLSRYASLRSGSLETKILEAFPLMRDVDVRYHFPSEIRIRVDERLEVLAVRISGGYALLDRDHVILRITEERDFSLPVLEGVSVLKEAVQGQVLDVDDESLLVEAARMISELIRHDEANRPGRPLMKEVRQFRQLSGLQFYLFIPLEQGGEIRVKLEDNRSLQDKFKLLSHLLDEEEILQELPGELDLTGQTAYFRPDTH